MYADKVGQKMVFMGGTAVRLIHDNQRFSEDLDFDSKGIIEREFVGLLDQVQKKLELEGLQVETVYSFKEAFHCRLKFVGLMQQLGLTKQKREKIMIRVDATNQDYDYEPELKLINKFEHFMRIKVAPKSLLLSQKILALLQRKRDKGRDYFDTVFLAGQTDPDYEYLRQKAKIATKNELKTALIKKVAEVDLQQLARDVEPFLMNRADVSRILMFTEFVEQRF